MLFKWPPKGYFKYNSEVLKKENSVSILAKTGENPEKKREEKTAGEGR